MNPSQQFSALRNAANQWAQKVVYVYKRKAPPQLQAQRSALLSSAKTIKGLIEKVFGTFDQLKHVPLGVIPVIIPVAVVATAAALIAKWGYDYNTYVKKLDAYEKAVKQGLSPTQAAKLVDNSSQGLLTNARAMLPWIAGLALLFVFKDKLKRSLS